MVVDPRAPGISDLRKSKSTQQRKFNTSLSWVSISDGLQKGTFLKMPLPGQGPFSGEQSGTSGFLKAPIFRNTHDLQSIHQTTNGWCSEKPRHPVDSSGKSHLGGQSTPFIMFACESENTNHKKKHFTSCHPLVSCTGHMPGPRTPSCWPRRCHCRTHRAGPARGSLRAMAEAGVF